MALDQKLEAMTAVIMEARRTIEEINRLGGTLTKKELKKYNRIIALVEATLRDDEKATGP